MRDTAKKLKILYWHLCGAFETWRDEIWKRDLGERYCCSGSHCCCSGATIADVWGMGDETR